MNLMMNNEEFGRKMAFIANQQAKFAVDIALLQEAQAKTSENLSRTEAAMANAENRLTEAEDLVTRLARVTNEGFKQLGEKINTLIDAHIRHEEAFAARQKHIDEGFEAVNEKINALTAKQDRTEELLQEFLLGLTNRRNGT
jgi:predicted  nucleic acid-binding Zn-ribbon protein